MSNRPDRIRPQITALYGNVIPTKRRAVAVQQGQSATVTFQFLDINGNPVNLTPYGDCGPQGPQNGPQGPDCLWDVEVRIKEAINPSAVLHRIDCITVDHEEGIVKFDAPIAVSNNAGIYVAEFGVYRPQWLMSGGSKSLAFTNKSFLWVDRGLFGDPRYPNLGPPTIDEIRMFIRDNGPEENLILEDFEFDLAEMCQSAENAVRYWNEVNPDVGVYFNTNTYCVRHKWLQAIAGHMMSMAAHRFRRNHLPYQAGGIAIDDQNKFQQYDQIGMALTQEYREWVKTKKVELNCYAAMTSRGSAYGSTAYHILNGGI